MAARTFSLVISCCFLVFGEEKSDNLQYGHEPRGLVDRRTEGEPLFRSLSWASCLPHFTRLSEGITLGERRPSSFFRWRIEIPLVFFSFLSFRERSARA